MRFSIRAAVLARGPLPASAAAPPLLLLYLADDT